MGGVLASTQELSRGRCPGRAGVFVVLTLLSACEEVGLFDMSNGCSLTVVELGPTSEVAADCHGQLLGVASLLSCRPTERDDLQFQRGDGTLPAAKATPKVRTDGGASGTLYQHDFPGLRSFGVQCLGFEVWSLTPARCKSGPALKRASTDFPSRPQYSAWT